MNLKDIGKITVLDIKDNPDGSCELVFDISDEFKENLVKKLNWSEWSEEKFNDLFINALSNYIDYQEDNNGN